MPWASMIAWPRVTPSREPRSISTRWRRRSRSTRSTVGGLDALGVARRRVDERAQPLVLLLDRLEAQQLEVVLARRVLERGVVGQQLAVRAQRGAQPVPRRDRRVHQHLQRPGRRRQPRADQRESLLAVIGHHQADRQRDQHQRPQAERRDARRSIAGTGLSQGRQPDTPITGSLQAEGAGVLFGQLEDAAAAAGDAGQRILGDDDRQPGLFHEQLVDVAAAARRRP